jgi:4-hydroxyphenylpyruvate dioxygenase-like putative hemolysin
LRLGLHQNRAQIALFNGPKKGNIWSGGIGRSGVLTKFKQSSVTKEPVMFKRIDHVEIVPADLQRTINFYTTILGFTLKAATT